MAPQGMLTLWSLVVSETTGNVLPISLSHRANLFCPKLQLWNTHLASEIILHNVINARRKKHKTEENEKHPETEITQGEDKSADYLVA